MDPIIANIKIGRQNHFCFWFLWQKRRRFHPRWPGQPAGWWWNISVYINPNYDLARKPSMAFLEKSDNNNLPLMAARSASNWSHFGFLAKTRSSNRGARPDGSSKVYWPWQRWLHPWLRWFQILPDRFLLLGPCCTLPNLRRNGHLTKSSIALPYVLRRGQWQRTNAHRQFA